MLLRYRALITPKMFLAHDRFDDHRLNLLSDVIELVLSRYTPRPPSANKSKTAAASVINADTYTPASSMSSSSSPPSPPLPAPPISRKSITAVPPAPPVPPLTYKEGADEYQASRHSDGHRAKLRPRIIESHVHAIGVTLPVYESWSPSTCQV